MSLRQEPHFRIESAQLAEWLVNQGEDRWWNVDCAPLLPGRLSFPAPADELAAELRRIKRILLVQDRRQAPTGQGEMITARDLGALVTRLGDNVGTNGPGQSWGNDRFFLLAWEGSDGEWLLVEDGETTQRSREDAAVAQETRK